MVNDPAAEKNKNIVFMRRKFLRSQMAEAWTRKLKGDRIEPFSAGTEPKEIDPRAVKVMAESGLDISGQKSKTVESLGDLEFDYVITLCDSAFQSCPFFPGKTRKLHVGFDDPPAPRRRGRKRSGGPGALPPRAGRDQGLRRDPCRKP